ncbi:MAG: Citronellyl-CoA dehydrogenase @ Acyl-CoA dehydrogenase, Mycobacterial subgroup FadE13, partial [uncultured Nocardioides sp.]
DRRPDERPGRREGRPAGRRRRARDPRRRPRRGRLAYSDVRRGLGCCHPGRGPRAERRGSSPARRDRLHARHRGGTALPRRPDPAHRRRSDRSAHVPCRQADGRCAM